MLSNGVHIRVEIRGSNPLWPAKFIVMRTLYEKNIRKETTEHFYPNKMTLGEFITSVKEDIHIFHLNMNKMPSQATDEKFIEQWYEQYLSWCEVEQEDEL